jgi:hypothetical protein
MILYSIGDSVVYGTELDDKESERFSSIVSKHMGAIDCNNASSGVSNDYIFRNTMRDVNHWIQTNELWSEESGWIKSDELKVIIGWTAPTRFEWWNGTSYQQERLWAGYDKWGKPDFEKTTEDEFVLNQTHLIPSYVRTFNYIQSLISLLELHGIDYYFFNSFYKYTEIKEPITKIDLWGRSKKQIGIEYLKYDMDNMYDYLSNNGGDFHQRKHPTKESHNMWANYIIKKWL